MTRPLPELLRPRARASWQTQPPSHDAHAPTANPRTRTITAHDTADAIAERAHLTALIASRYNSRRAKELARLFGIDLTTWHAAQELTNRRLADLTPTGQRTPQPRYHFPEQLAAHHAHDTTARPIALDIAALAHHDTDRTAYLTHLQRHGANYLAATVASALDDLDGAHRELTERLRQPQRRYTMTRRVNGSRVMVTAAEHAAYEIAHTLARLERDAKHSRDIDRRTRKRKDAQRRRDHKQHHSQRPADTDELTGWHDLVPNKPPRELAHLGRLGRKRTLSDTGKTPNRIANYLGDPARRIYTRKTRGTNALVIVDASGSMSLDADDLETILTASHGATVIAYSADDSTSPNLHLLAHNQRRVRHLPAFSGGNGIDAPAVSWAIKHYRKHGAPVLWITDGRATGRNDYSHHELRAQCARLAQRHGVTIARDIPQALDDLATLARGQRPPQRLAIFR